MIKYLLLILIIPTVAFSGVSSFLTDSTNEGSYTEWRTQNTVVLANYISAGSSGIADSMKIKVYTASVGSDTLYPVIYNADGTVLVTGTGLVLTGGTGSHEYILQFGHSGSISSDTRYWIGVCCAWSGTSALYTSAQNAADSSYYSQNVDPVPLTDMQTKWRYLNSATSYNFPLKMNLWYSSNDSEPSSVRQPIIIRIQ